MKTACEEAADILCEDFMPPRHYAGDKRELQEREAIAKRLRSEARELKQWRATALDLLSNDPARWNKARKACEAYAARIKKARKAK